MQTPYERFLSQVNTTTPTGCWEWTGYVSPRGYGRFYFRGMKWQAQRAAWVFANGEVPVDLLVLHHCDNRKCVRPSHLFLGSPLDNMRDMIAKGRERHPVRYGLRTWHKLSEHQVRAIRAAYTAGGITQEALATQYGVSRRLIGGIVTGKRWRSVQ